MWCISHRLSLSLECMGQIQDNKSSLVLYILKYFKDACERVVGR